MTKTDRSARPSQRASANEQAARSSWLSELLRALRWHRRKIAAGFAVIAVFATLSALTPVPNDVVDVVTAAKALPAGTKLGASDVKVRQVPRPLVPDEAITQPEQAHGRTLAASLTSGSILTSATILGEASVAANPDEQLVPIRVADTGVVNLLRVGDHISVVAVSFDGKQSVLATRVRVAALPQQSNSSIESGALIVVAADQPTAAKLAGAGAQSKLGIVLT